MLHLSFSPAFLLVFLLPNKLTLRSTRSSLFAYFLCEVKLTEPIQAVVTWPKVFLFLLTDLFPRQVGFFGLLWDWRVFFNETSCSSRLWILKLVDSYSSNVASFCIKKHNGLVLGPVSSSVQGLCWEVKGLELGTTLPEKSAEFVNLNESEQSLKAWCVLSCWTKRAWTIKRNGICSFCTSLSDVSCDSFWQFR